MPLTGKYIMVMSLRVLLAAFEIHCKHVSLNVGFTESFWWYCFSIAIGFHITMQFHKLQSGGSGHYRYSKGASTSLLLLLLILDTVWARAKYMHAVFLIGMKH